ASGGVIVTGAVGRCAFLSGRVFSSLRINTYNGLTLQGYTRNTADNSDPCGLAYLSPQPENTCISSPIPLVFTGASAYYESQCGKRPYICKKMEKQNKPFKPLPSEPPTKAYVKEMSMSEYDEYDKLSLPDKQKFLMEHYDKIVGINKDGNPDLPDDVA
ncbi:hypothetical protein BGZ49_005168, partial [Haplosporangium sp. Z 27]